MNEELLRLEDVTKTFPGVVANDQVSLLVKRGTVRGLVGENGAGKTTLMRIVYGMYQPDSGQIYYKGRLVDFDNPREAMAAGISMVHQHSMLVPSMNVVENVLLAHPLGRLPDFSEMADRLREVAEQYDLQVDLRSPARDLSVAQRQTSEILKALYGEAELIILDEPTTVLTPQEATALFRSLRRLTEEGKTIILITHKLPEVMKATDTVTVLRAGQVVATKRTDETNEAELASLMVGREVRLRREREFTTESPEKQHSTVLSIEDLSVEDHEGHQVVRNVSFSVNAGEIVGIAAVQGNGQSELVDAIMGLRDADSGQILLNNNNIADLSTRKRRELGVCYVPRDRHERGINLQAKVWENLVLGHHHDRPFASGGRLQRNKIQEFTKRRIAEYKIATPSGDVRVANLSGGNQQKVVIARELAADAALVIAEEPTQGVDVAATEFIRETLANMRDDGAAILLVSSSLDEIFDLADRIVVMYSGELMGVVDIREADEQFIGRMMMGVERQLDS